MALHMLTSDLRIFPFLLDYSTTIFVNGPQNKSRSVVGMKEYMVPEVHTGVVGEEIHSFCGPSVHRTFTVCISKELVALDPLLMRPMMSDLIQACLHTYTVCTVLQCYKDTNLCSAFLSIRSPTFTPRHTHRANTKLP